MARADVQLRSHRYRDAIASLKDLESGNAPDPTDLCLRIAGALAELGRVDEVRKELGDMLEEETGKEGNVVLDLDGAPSVEEVEKREVEKREVEKEKGEKKKGEKKEKKGEMDAEEAGEIQMPYVPTYPEPRVPTGEDRARALHIMGRAHLVAGDLTAAMGSLQYAAGKVPDLPDLQLDVGNALRESGDVKGALAAYEMAADHDLDDESPRALAGICHLQLGDPRSAERDFDSAIGIAPGYALAWLGKARALMARGKAKRAVRYIREALRIDPHLTEARLSLAEAYTAIGKTKEAKSEARRAYALDPEADEARKLLESMGASPPGPPAPVPSVEPPGPTPLTTRPPPGSRGTGGSPVEVPVEEAPPETAPPEEDPEEMPGPGPALEEWFREHRRPPPGEGNGDGT